MGARKDQSISYSRLTQEEVEAFCLQWGIDSMFNPEAPGLDKVLHFEVVFRSARYDPSLLSFRRFFDVAKNGDWFIFKTSQRHPDDVLNELESSESELDCWFLKSIRACPSRLRPFPEHLLVLMGISKLWDKPDRDRVLMRDVMSALDFIKSDGTSEVIFTDTEATEGNDVVVRGAEQRFEGSSYVNVPNVKGFTKVVAYTASTHRSTRRTGAGQPSSSETVDLSDDIEILEDVEVSVEGNKGELPLVDSCSLMDDDQMISKMILDACNLASLIPEGISHFRKRMQEYEAFSKKRDGMKASMVSLKKESEGFAEMEKALVMKVGELIQRYELEVNKLKKQDEALKAREEPSSKVKEGLEASSAQVTEDNKWLIQHCFQQVDTYLLHSSEFNRALGDVYTKLLIHGRNQGYTAGYEACEARTPKDKSSLYQPKAFEVFKDTVLMIEHLTYPYVGEVSECFGKPLSVLKELKPRGLNEAF
ncbi:hypothetical protein Hanom_Chr16g01426511 [Helianthus anomalus]